MPRGRKVLEQIDTRRVEQAIQAAEKETSGEIRVSVARFFWGNPRRAAERAFTRLGMTNTRQRNGILFFIVPSRRKFVVLGDEGIHSKVGHQFWEHIVHAMSEKFRTGHFTEGLVHGIERAGHELSKYFPFDAKTDVNELPDKVDIES